MPEQRKSEGQTAEKAEERLRRGGTDDLQNIQVEMGVSCTKT